jgi:foldase protein PrsA
MNFLNSITSFFAQIRTNIRIAWLRYWALQRRFVFDHTTVSFRKALLVFVSVLLAIYFVIGLPILGYMIYSKKAEGISLSLASTLYPFPVATVGGEIILLKPYSDRLNYLKFFSKQTQQSLPAENDLRTQVVDKLVDEAVIRQWANKAGIVVTNDDIQATYDKIVKDRGSETDVTTVLSQLYNLSPSEFKRLIPDLLYREKIQKQLIEQVHVKHILVSNEALAKRLVAEATAANFDAEAKQYSEDKTTRDNGGDLGFFDRDRANQLAPELVAPFFSTAAGSVAGPIKTKYGYHVIIVTEKTGTEQKTFDQWLDEKRAATKVRKFLK